MSARDSRGRRLPIRTSTRGWPRDREPGAIAEPFVGVHAAGEAREGLFPIQATGVSTDDLVAGARRFLDGLTTFGREKAILDLDGDEWRTWCNFHLAYFRHGVPLGDITATERERVATSSRTALGDEVLQDRAGHHAVE